MYYICSMRTMIRTADFDEFYNSLPANVQNKVKYAMSILAEVKVINTKLVKRLVDTDFYELRISVGNEYRESFLPSIMKTLSKPNRFFS